MDKPGRCVHFTGIQNDKCKAGILYADVGRPIPCITLNGKRNDCCPTYTEPTAEQIAKSEAEFNAAMDRMRKVMPVVAGWRTWKKNHRVAKQEVITCPVCDGRLHLSQAAYNGHVWGKCETEGCIQWME